VAPSEPGSSPPEPAQAQPPQTPPTEAQLEAEATERGRSEGPDAPRSRLSAKLAILGLVLGVWAVLPPYTGPDINTETRVEVADHIVPAVVLLAVVTWSFFLLRRPDLPGLSLLAAGLAILLAGIWMTATHLPLMNQAFRGGAGDPSLGAALYHTLPGLAVGALGLVWSAVHWRQAS
jgi:hypothetical protein